ncbi:MAG: DUF1499 domain-containing protein [Desulfovibrionales bacterium]
MKLSHRLFGRGIRFTSILALLFCVLSCSTQPQFTPGVANGKLQACPQTPNCVSSMDFAGTSFIPPLMFTGDPFAAWSHVQNTVLTLNGTIQQDTGRYLHATFTSRILGLIDDLELLLEEKEGVIHIRSASRTGYWDLGVNSDRVERIRTRFLELQSVPPGIQKLPAQHAMLYSYQ